MTDIHEDAVIETADLDGYGVFRTLVLDKPTSESLNALLADLHDERISSVKTEDEQTRITFVSDIRADNKHPFNLPAAVEVLTEEKPKPKKRAAKKAVSRGKLSENVDNVVLDEDEQKPVEF